MLAVIARASHVAVGAGAGNPAVAGQASHPAVAVWFALGAAALAAVVVAMAWSVHVRQIRLAELLVRRQFLVIADAGGPGRALDEGGRGALGGRRDGAEGAGELEGAVRTRPGSAEVIEGPDHLVAGQQARYRVRTSGPQQVVSWAVGGGSVSQSPDPAHPDELLLIADQPGQLTITAVADVTVPTPPFTLRLFLHGWGLVVVAVLIVGFAGALDALGNFTSSDFIALVVPLAALLGVIAVARGATEVGSHPGHPGHPGHGKGSGQI